MPNGKADLESTLREVFAESGAVVSRGFKDLGKWLRSTLLDAGTIVEQDLSFITVTDDLEETVAIMLEHRRWKERKIKGIPANNGGRYPVAGLLVRLLHHCGIRLRTPASVAGVDAIRVPMLPPSASSRGRL
jgi:hypothetical protein